MRAPSSASKGTWMRLTRRAVRDYNFRGTGVEDTLDMWANVRRGGEAVYLPLQEQGGYYFSTPPSPMRCR